jgi:hypothetical protein
VEPTRYASHSSRYEEDSDDSDDDSNNYYSSYLPRPQMVAPVVQYIQPPERSHPPADPFVQQNNERMQRQVDSLTSEINRMKLEQANALKSQAEAKQAEMKSEIEKLKQELAKKSQTPDPYVSQVQKDQNLQSVLSKMPGMQEPFVIVLL